MTTETSSPVTLTKQGIKLRGWTDAMIRDFLGEPDKIVPRSKCSRYPPYCIYRTARVVAAEQTQGFAERRDKAVQRRARSIQAAKKREAQVIQWARTVPITWMENAPSSASQAIKQGCRAWEDFRHFERDDYMADARSADNATQKRWAVNYLRHECMDYDNLGHDTKGSPGTYEARSIIKNRCLDLIATRYPALAGEARRQRTQHAQAPV